MADSQGNLPYIDHDRGQLSYQLRQCSEEAGQLSNAVGVMGNIQQVHGSCQGLTDGSTVWFYAHAISLHRGAHNLNRQQGSVVIQQSHWVQTRQRQQTDLDGWL